MAAKKHLCGQKTILIINCDSGNIIASAKKKIKSKKEILHHSMVKKPLQLKIF